MIPCRLESVQPPSPTKLKIKPGRQVVMDEAKDPLFFNHGTTDIVSETVPPWFEPSNTVRVNWPF
jgi:hypothetical protein